MRRSRLGLVMAAASEADRELLGTSIPRRCPLAPRPGLAWLVDGAEASLVQVAAPEDDEPSWHPLTSSALEVVRSSA
jgi:hypothetical protein